MPIVELNSVPKKRFNTRLMEIAAVTTGPDSVRPRPGLGGFSSAAKLLHWT